MDVSARLGPYIASGATLPRSRIVLDCEKWNSFEWDARVWKSRIRRAHLEFGELSKNYAGKRPSEERTSPIRPEKALPLLQGFVEVTPILSRTSDGRDTSSRSEFGLDPLRLPFGLKLATREQREWRMRKFL